MASCFFPGFVYRPYCAGVPGCCLGSATAHSVPKCCAVDAGFQNMLTPLDTVVDVTVRAMPIGPCHAFETSELVPVIDPRANQLGHKWVFASDVYPTGDAVWPGDRPPRDAAHVESLVTAAARVAAASPVLRRALADLRREDRAVQADMIDITDRI